MAKGPTRKTIARLKAERLSADTATIAEWRARALPQYMTLATAAEAYLAEFGPEGYELGDFVDFVSAQVGVGRRPRHVPREFNPEPLATLRIACTEAAMHIENMSITPGGVRDRLVKRLRAALAFSVPGREG